jgi:hypothetical protein
MEWHQYLGWHWLDLCLCQIDASDNGINKYTLHKLVGPVAHPLDVDANIVSWILLVFDVEPSVS